MPRLAALSPTGFMRGCLAPSMESLLKSMDLQATPSVNPHPGPPPAHNHETTGGPERLTPSHFLHPLLCFPSRLLPMLVSVPVPSWRSVRSPRRLGPLSPLGSPRLLSSPPRPHLCPREDASRLCRVLTLHIFQALRKPTRRGGMPVCLEVTHAAASQSRASSVLIPPLSRL
jgi:hypothetical protein